MCVDGWAAPHGGSPLCGDKGTEWYVLAYHTCHVNVHLSTAQYKTQVYLASEKPQWCVCMWCHGSAIPSACLCVLWQVSSGMRKVIAVCPNLITVTHKWFK